MFLGMIALNAVELGHVEREGHRPLDRLGHQPAPLVLVIVPVTDVSALKCAAQDPPRLIRPMIGSSGARKVRRSVYAFPPRFQSRRCCVTRFVTAVSEAGSSLVVAAGSQGRRCSMFVRWSRPARGHPRPAAGEDEPGRDDARGERGRVDCEHASTTLEQLPLRWNADLRSCCFAAWILWIPDW